jgi:WD40 repeat protein
MRYILLFFATVLLSVAAPVVKPFHSIDVEGNVIDISVNAENLYVATDAGAVEIYNWKTGKLLKKISFDPIHDFMGDLMKAKVFGIDTNADATKLLIQVQAEDGARVLYLYSHDKLTKLIDEKSRVPMREVRFVDDNHLLIATMDNELILFEIDTGKMLYRNKLSLSVFSDFQLNEDHSKVASSCESGIVYVTDVKSGKVLRTLEGGNKDNVFKVDFKNNRILACGQDRKAAFYDLESGRMVIYPTTFLVYAGALNPDASLSAFGNNEENDIGIYDNDSKALKIVLKGARSTLNNIIFIDEKTLISSSDDNHILIWRIP